MLEYLRRREINFGEFLDCSFKLYWKNLLWIGLFTIIFSVSLQYLLSYAIVKIVQINPYGYLNGDMSFMVSMIPIFFVSIVFSFLLMMSITLIIWKSANGEKLEIKEVFQFVFSKIFSSIKVSILVFGALFLCGMLPVLVISFFNNVFLSFLSLIPGIYFIIIYVFAQQALVIEDKRGKTALRYSRELVKGRWWKIFGFTVGAGIIMGLISLIILAIFDFFAFLTGGSTLIRAVIENILRSFSWVSTTVLFINLNLVDRRFSDPITIPTETTETL